MPLLFPSILLSFAQRQFFFERKDTTLHTPIVARKGPLPPQDLHISWDRFQEDTRVLATEIRRTWPEIHAIVGIARGGLAPALMVARELDIRYVDTLCMVAYEDFKTTGEVKVLKEPHGLTGENSRNVLILDDLVDSGATGRKAREILPFAHFATVYAKPKGMELVNMYVQEIAQETWLHFPWDLGLGRVLPLVGNDS